MPRDDHREARQSVEQAGRLALAEMRRLLDAMRSDEGDVALAPQPGLADIDHLVDEVRAAGLAVDLRVEGEPVTMSPGLDRSAYRIVQEGLANTVRHANASRARVALRYSPRRLGASDEKQNEWLLSLA